MAPRRGEGEEKEGREGMKGVLADFGCAGGCGVVVEGWAEPPLSKRAMECPVCGLGVLVWKPSVRVQVFKPFMHWNLDPDGPVRIESKEQLARECKKRGKIAEPLL